MVEIVNWSESFENADTRKRQRLGWFLCPTGCDSRGYRALMREGKDGLAALGVFQALCQLMGTLPRVGEKGRGKFLNSDKSAMEIEDLSDLTRIEVADMRQAIGRLVAVGWLALIEQGNADNLPVACQSSPGFVKGEGEGEGEGEDNAQTEKSVLSWSSDDGFSGITEKDQDAWAVAYPACNISRQLAAANEWLLSNPAKAHKKQWRRFITGWLGRAQEKGGDIPSNAKNRRTESSSNRGTTNEGKANEYAL